MLAHVHRAADSYQDKTQIYAEITPSFVTDIAANEVFVFGSNLLGIHGGGAALSAKKMMPRDTYIRPIGLTVHPENSGDNWRGVYAIPTKKSPSEPFDTYLDIWPSVSNLISMSERFPHIKFLLTAVGCCRAGFTSEDVAPMFIGTLPCPNITVPEEWAGIMQSWLHDTQFTSRLIGKVTSWVNKG